MDICHPPTKGVLQTVFQNQAPSDQTTSHQEQLCQSPKEQVPAGDIAFSLTKTGHSAG